MLPDDPSKTLRTLLASASVVLHHYMLCSEAPSVVPGKGEER